MGAHEFEITISPDGTVRGVVSGIKGKACRKYAAQLSELLGVEVSFEPSSEFFEPETHENVDIELDRER